MAITEVTMYQTSSGKLFPTKALANKEEALEKFRVYNEAIVTAPELYKHESEEILEYLLAHREIILEVLGVCDKDEEN